MRRFPIHVSRFTILVLALALSAAGALAPSATRLTGRITEYVVPTPESLPHDPAVDAQNRVFYTGQRANTIGMFDPATQKFTEFKVPTADSGPHGLVADDKGRIWFTENWKGQIGVVDPATGKFEEFHAPTARDPHTPIFDTRGILWFTAQASNLIVRFNPRDKSMTEYPVPTPEARPYGIVTAPDGRVWFCELAGNKIAWLDPRANPQSVKITEIEVPVANGGPRRIAVDAEAVWTTLNRAGKLARYSIKTGEWKVWDSPGGERSQPYGIAIAADGAVWYNEAGADQMVRFDAASEKFETFPMPSPKSVVRHMVRDSNGTLWLAVSGPRGTDNNQIARID